MQTVLLHRIQNYFDSFFVCQRLHFCFKLLTGCIHSCYRRDLNWNSIHLPFSLTEISDHNAKSESSLEDKEKYKLPVEVSIFSVTLYLPLCSGNYCVLLWWGLYVAYNTVTRNVRVDIACSLLVLVTLWLWKACYLLSQKGNGYCYAWRCRNAECSPFPAYVLKTVVISFERNINLGTIWTKD